jgi:tripartite motif-containing protein 71
MKNQNVNMLRIASLCLTILFLGLLSASITHAGTYSYVTQWGSEGSSNGQFNAPVGIAVDSTGNVYVADKENNRIQKFDSNGKYITQWSSYYNNWKLSDPTGVAVDSVGNIYIANQGNKSVVKMNSKGVFITQWGSEVIGDGKYFNPTGIAVDSSSNVYVTNTFSNNRIVKFNSNGYCLTQWGSSGNKDGQVSSPYSVAVDSSGNVYVADYYNGRIQKFDSDGNFLYKWGSGGSGSGQFNLVYGVAVDSSGSVYTTEKYIHRVQKFDNSGNYLMQWGSGGSYNGQFNGPSGIAVDSSGYVYVVDTGNNRIQKFALPTLTYPLANFTSNVTQGLAPLNVQFTDKSTNFPTSWKWNFGDGFNSTLQNPMHVYSKTGNYTVNLTVTNSKGANSKLAVITVSAKPALPIANFTSNVTSGTAPLNVAFTDKSTGSPTAWNWTFGDGTYSTSKSPTYIYSKAGNYTVAIKASNSAGSNTTTKTSYIKVTGVIKPVAAFSASPTSGTTPLIVAFTDKSTGSPTSWKWTFGDGTTSTTHNPVHTYIKAGSHTVTLTATNAAGNNTTTKTNYINVAVSTSKPITAFSATPTSGNIPLIVTFTDKSTGTPTSWKWTFGDGTTSTTHNPVHTYIKAGNLTVTLTATNAAGSNTTTKIAYIKVTTPVKPVAAFTASPTSGNASLKVQFTDKSTGSPTSWKWDFGDGTTSTTHNPLHTYIKKGKLTVTLTVKNAAGSSTKTMISYITVN